MIKIFTFNKYSFYIKLYKNNLYILNNTYVNIIL